jgi:hypothetical protein
MKMRKISIFAMFCAAMTVAACSDNSDMDGDGKVSRSERADEMRRDGYLAMQPGRWRTSFAFTDIDVPRLGNKEKEQIREELPTAHREIIVPERSRCCATRPRLFWWGRCGRLQLSQSTLPETGQHAAQLWYGQHGKADMDLEGTVGDTEFRFDTTGRSCSDCRKDRWMAL